jgi:hypothetical protein
MSTFSCQATVYVPDWDAEDACDLPAMGYVWDEEFGQWPACTQHRDRNTGIRADLTDLIARRPELRDVGIAGYLVGAAVEGAPGMPPGPLPCDCGCSPRALVRFGRSVAA